MSAAKRTANKAAVSSDKVEEQLARYRSMRNFDITAEPAGGTEKTHTKKSGANKPVSQDDGLPFVVQKHAATRLHYDFRLGWRGVLKSWAVTKGPSYYTGDKRLAVQVEDHPIEYGGFEGIIPKGQYGGGTVMVWDQGTWEPHGNADEGLAKGNLKFTLHGTKLQGDWALIRMGGKAAEEKKPNWLLIKEHDGKERTATDPCVTVEEPDSVVTGRTMEEIANHQDHVWGTQGSSRQEPQLAAKKDDREPEPARPKTFSLSPQLDAMLRSAPRKPLPEFVTPQLALQVREAPEGPEWIHELKLDGYRMQARVDGSTKDGNVQMLTRSGLDWTHRMAALGRAVAELPVNSALLDGEVVVLDEKGATSFAQLQAAFQGEKQQTLTFFVFDLLYLNGHDLRDLPLENRKQILQQVLQPLHAESDQNSAVRFSEHLGERGREIFQKACELGAEGIVSKKLSSPYSAGRNGNWLKIKCVRQQEFVIGGFTPPSKSGVGIGALLLGYYQGDKLIYAGRTGTGFTEKMRREMRAMLDKVQQKQSPFNAVPADGARDAIWVQPKYVGEVAFATWTADNLVRQASFKGLREDKPAREVKREVAVELNETPGSEPTGTAAARATSANKKENARSAKQTSVGKRSGKADPHSDPFPIPLTHPDKQVDEESGLTKRQLAEYFWAIQGYMLPHIQDRPLSIVRCPEGSTKPCFFQKHVTSNLPQGIEGIKIRGRRSGIVENYITLSTPLGLAGLAQMGVLEIHPWGSRNSDVEKPDRIIFDLDPDESISWQTLAESAREVRERLRQCKLESFLKTTGGKGLHIVAPIAPEYDWPVVKQFCHEFAAQMEAGNRSRYLIKMTKAARKGKIFIDYLRNDRGATSVAAYSPRARHGAPVALPLEWSELEGSEVRRFRVADFPEWKDRLRNDPWKTMEKKRQGLHQTILRKFKVEVEPAGK
ncbi:MAG TPA: DNA ligase D [Acidobacteriaceae bacterium]|nr:DNA ligase D [Acidobacteriaceae bacterium]